MSKKRKAPARKSQPSARRVFLAGLNPLAIVDLLDDRYQDTGGPDGSPYRRGYEELKASLIAHDSNAVALFALFNEADASGMVEAAMRQAGFVQGFDACRQLILGELDLAALKTEGAA